MAYLDNDTMSQGTLIDNITIISPSSVKSIQYEYIILMSVFAPAMYEQLIYIGVDKSKILYWGEFNARFLKAQREYFRSNFCSKIYQKKILIVTIPINYDGGTMAAVYAAMCLQSKNYKVEIVAEEGDDKLIHEINDYGIDVIIYDIVPYIRYEYWIEEYDIIIVNTFPMVRCACELSKNKPVLWWLHEASIAYKTVLKQFYDNISKQSMRQINIYAVSNIAKQNFNFYFPDRVNKILNYGIPDMYNINKIGKRNKIIFAVIGSVHELKAQDILLKAINELESIEKTEFWIIGKVGKNPYSCKIMEMAKQNLKVKIKGLLTREEMYNIYSQIDVVVCTSKEETMSNAIVEGMMMKKVCITTENTGVASYIENGKSGFIVPVGDEKVLRNTIKWIIDNKDQIHKIGEKARIVYKKYFSMDVFGEKLEEAVEDTMTNWQDTEY